MGIEFRSGNYLRRVRLGKRTVKEGEAAAIWNINGVHREVIGPKREQLFFSTIRFLDRFTANSHQYLIIRHKNGLLEHVKGPLSMFCNPVFHDFIQIADAIHLRSNYEGIVVYKEQEEGGIEGKSDANIERRIIHGPAIFVPTIDEKVHEFCWHGRDHQNIGNNMTPNANVFQVLKMNTQLWKVDVPLRTKDNILATINLTFSIKVSSLETLLETSNDPIRDMLSSVQADMSKTGSELLSSEVYNIGNIFSDLNAFPNLMARSKAIGYSVEEVSFRGFLASEELQEQYAQQIQMKTKLAQQKQKSEQEQKLVDQELENQRRRANQEHEIECLKTDHKLKMERKVHEAENRKRAGKNSEMLGFLKGMQELGVDLTKMLTSDSGKGVRDEMINLTPALAEMHPESSSRGLFKFSKT